MFLLTKSHPQPASYVFRILHVPVLGLFCKSTTLVRSMVIGLVIALGQYLENVAPMVKYLDMDLKKNVYPHSIFNKWLGAANNRFNTRGNITVVIPVT